jgi:hypothetical protein
VQPTAVSTKKKKAPEKHQVGLGRVRKDGSELNSMSLNDLDQSNQEAWVRVVSSLDSKLNSLCRDIDVSAYNPVRRVYKLEHDADNMALTDSIMRVMQESKKFKKMFKNMESPSTCRRSFIIAYPNASKAAPQLHRDDIAEVYTVFVLLSPVTRENGSVQVYLGSQKWPRSYRLSSEDVLKARERQVGTPVDEPVWIIGERYDIVALDGRLLHRSVFNTTDDVRTTFCFTVFCGGKFPNYISQYGH